MWVLRGALGETGLGPGQLGTSISHQTLPGAPMCHALCCVTLGSQRERLSLWLALKGEGKQVGTGPLCRMGPGPAQSEQTGLGRAGLQPAEQRRCSERGSAAGTTMNVQGFTGRGDPVCSDGSGRTFSLPWGRSPSGCGDKRSESLTAREIAGTAGSDRPRLESMPSLTRSLMPPSPSLGFSGSET